MSKEQNRDYRDKERDRNREDRFSRSCKSKALHYFSSEQIYLHFSSPFLAYAKHSSSRSSRVRWPHESDSIQGHRKRNEGNSH